MLIVNLLSNYLPSQEVHATFYRDLPHILRYFRVQNMNLASKCSLPTAKSLHVRYPPVCDSCLPLVEDELRQKEQMARVKALGGSLKKGKNVDERHQVQRLKREKYG